MKDTKIIRYLSALDAGEMKFFQQFAHSPYHNSNKQVAILLDCLAKYHPAFDHKNLNKESVYRKAHPKDKDYHEGRMNLLMAQLVQLFKRFLAFEEMRKDEFLQRKLSLHAYQKKRLDDEFKKEVKKQEEALGTWREDESYHLEKLLLNKEVFHHPATPRHQVGMLSLEKYIEALDMFFVWEKVKMLATILNRKRILREEINLEFSNEVINYFQQNIEENPVLFFYKDLIELLQGKREDKFNDLIAKYENAIAIFTADEKSTNLISLINYSSQKYRAGSTAYKSHSFKLNILGLANGVFLENGFIDDLIFANIVAVACVNGEFEWTTDFIAKYKDRLKAKNKDDAIGLSMAYLHYYIAITSKDKHNFNMAIDFLNKIKTNNPFYYYRYKLLTLRIHYEYYLHRNEDYFFVLDLCNAFEKQLKRDKMMEYNKKSTFINFVKISKKILTASSSPDFGMKEKEQLLQFVEKENSVFGKEWLLEKIMELKTVS